MINRLAVIGVGLIGGSLALALRRRGEVGEIVGCGRQRENLETAVRKGIIDRYETSPERAVGGADMVVLSMSLGSTGDILRTIGGVIDNGATVTDVGSVKGPVIEEARTALGDTFPNFVAGHPIAGTEHSGADAAFATLYENHKVILTPSEDTDPVAIERVSTMWEQAGAEVVQMPAELHDAALAATSHLPHLLAYALVEVLASRDDSDSIFAFAAGGFRDFTRIASSNPGMWTEICLANKAPLAQVCQQFAERLDTLREALDANDAETLREIFERARDAREACLIPESNEPR